MDMAPVNEILQLVRFPNCPKVTFPGNPSITELEVLFGNELVSFVFDFLGQGQ